VFDRSLAQDDSPLGARAPSSWMPGRGSETVRTIIAGLGVFILAWASIALVRHTGRVTALWPANAILLVFLLRSDVRRWPIFVLAGFLANVTAGVMAGVLPWVTTGLSLANMVEVLLAAAGLRRLIGRDIDLSRRRDMLIFGALAGLLTPTLSACLAVAWLRLPIDQTILPHLGAWMLSDGLGAVIFVPALLTLTPKAIRHLCAPGTAVRNLLLFAALIVTTVCTFSQSQIPLLFLILPALLLIAFQLELAGTALGVLLVALLSASFTMAGQGPVFLVRGSPTVQAVALQIFLTVLVVSIFPVASALARARQLKTSLATSLEITEAARAESVEAQRWARMAEQTAHIGYWRLAAVREKTSWSPEVFRIHGLDPNGPADPEAAINAVHPDDLERVLEGLKAARSEGVSYEGVYRIRRTDGSWRTISCRTVSEKDAGGQVIAVVGTILDITEFKQIEAAALESEARYRLLADKASDIISRVDPEGRHTYVSPACLQMLGYTPEELIDRLSMDFVHPDDQVALYQAYESQADEGREHAAQPIRYRFRHKTGEWVWLETHPTVVFDDRGEAIEFISVSRDVTMAKTAEAELMAAREAAEAATLAKGEFLANMSHEIRTPLTSIMGFSSLLKEVAELPENVRHYVQRISTAGQSLLSVVNDILDFSKLEAGQVELDPHPFDPTAFVLETTQLLAVQATNKGLDWRTEIDGALPGLITADSARLRQVLLNLLGNAIKFTAKGGVVVRIGYEPAGRGRLAVSIVDTGPGIPAERRDRLFQRFSQVDGSVSRTHGGTGLGLAICKSLVELMGGDIGVTSEGNGSTFWFTIDAPLAEYADADPADREPPTIEEDEEFRPAHILIVDDLAVNRELVRAMLTPFGHDFEEAENGADAVRAALRSRFDLILMDLQMPGMDGFEAARVIRATCVLNRGTPIIALSANVLPAHVLASQAAGMDDHLGKPIVPITLVTKVAMWAGATHSPEPAPAAIKTI